MNSNNPRTPGVYISELDAFPSSVTQVPTAIPAFLGYTEKAEKDGKPLGEPLLINSMLEFESHFGGPPPFKFPIVKADAPDGKAPASYDVGIEGDYYRIGDATPGNHFYLYHCLRHFFENGGGRCYIASVGKCSSAKPGSEPVPTTPSKEDFWDSLEKLKNPGLPKPTMVLAPDALLLSEEDCYEVQNRILRRCGEWKDRMAILEVYRGFESNDEGKVIDNFRRAIGSEDLSYGVAYYPFLNTTIVETREISDANLDASGMALSEVLPGETSTVDSNVSYRKLMEAVARKINILPPGPAMAGMMTRIDEDYGVWKAPANEGIQSVMSPTVAIANEEQETLTVDTMGGKSINAIRSFPVRGPAIVWGARTLDGNSLDWRYLSVRRTVIMIEQSIANAALQFVFNGNTSSTWQSVESAIGDFLQSLWRDGALQGSSASDAYDVSVGLGKTMTPIDVREGIMRISVKVALVRPAEFIVITYEQVMENSGESNPNANNS